MKNLIEFNDWLEEESQEYEPVFSIEELKEFTQSSKGDILRIKAFLNRRLGQFVAEGNYRGTWIIDTHRVIKLVKSQSYKTQNKNEALNSKCLGERFAVQVLDHDPDFLWLIEENIKVPGLGIISIISKLLSVPITKAQFPFLFFEGADATKNPTHKRRWLYPMNKKYHEELYGVHEWYTNLMNSLVQCYVSADDFHEDNWGLREGSNEPILIDLGF